MKRLPKPCGKAVIFDGNRVEESLKSSKAAGFFEEVKVTTEEDAEGKVLKKTTRKR